MRLTWRDFSTRVAITGCLILAALCFSLAHAAPLTSASIELGQFLSNSRLLELPERPSNFIGLNLLLIPVAPLYWNNRVHALSVGEHVRWVGWHFELGLGFDRLDLYFDHNSQHALDRAHQLYNPVSNAVAVRWRIYP